MIYLQAYNPKNHPIQLEVDATQLGYQIASIKGYTKKIEALRFILTTTTQSFSALPELYIRYCSKLVLPNAPEALPKVDNEQIIAAHYGVFASYETAEGCTQIYIIPLRIRYIRPVSRFSRDRERPGGSSGLLPREHWPRKVLDNPC